MKLVIQRSKEAKVLVENAVVSEIQSGLVVFLCIEKDDTEKTVQRAQNKLLGRRCFSDENDETGKMNLNIVDKAGELLLVSQFTLSWSGEKGNRPGFDQSMPPGEALRLFNLFCDGIKDKAPLKRGAFGKNMDVFLVNDGPVTFSLSF